MNKFLKKKPVVITLCVLAVLMLAFYIGMLVRPVAVGMSYKGKTNLGLTKVDTTIKINNGKKLTKITKNTKVEYSYFVKGREIVVFLGHDGEMSKKEYNETKDKVLKNWDYYEALGWVNSTNAFKMESGSDEFTSNGSIVFAIVGGIITVTLVVFAGLAVAASCKKSKKKRK